MPRSSGRAFATRRPTHMPLRAQTCRSIAHAEAHYNVHLPYAKPFQLSITAHRDISLPVKPDKCPRYSNTSRFLLSLTSPRLLLCVIQFCAAPLLPVRGSIIPSLSKRSPARHAGEKGEGKIAGRAHHAFELRDSFRKIEMQIRAFDDSLNVRAPAKPCALSPSPPRRGHSHVEATYACSGVR